MVDGGKQGRPLRRRREHRSGAQQSSPGSVSVSPPVSLGLGVLELPQRGVRAVLRGEGAQGMAQRGADPPAPFHPRDGLSSRPGRGTNAHGDHGRHHSGPWAVRLCLRVLSPHPEIQALVSLSQAMSEL